ncbi:MAG: sulfite exporter TauE/SafE family protein, partial [Candidatus Saccharibacteria bacterium]
MKTTIDTKGMHCRSCELLIEGSVKRLEGVTKVRASAATGKVRIWSDRPLPEQQLAAAVKEAGYELGRSEKAFVSRSPQTYWNLLVACIVVVSGYLIIRLMGLDHLSQRLTQQSVAMTPVVGLVAGVSSCMALIGGLVLAVSAAHAKKHPEASGMERFEPHLLFNLGRISGFGLLGGLVGLLGSSLQPSVKVLSVLTLAVGLLMVLLGLKLTEIFPMLERVNITLPKFLGRKGAGSVGSYSKFRTFLGGAMTFFLPCGFTQAMQLFALTTGSFTQGALIMSLFALGTAPGLLGIGGLSAVFNGRKAKAFFAIAGLAVILFGSINVVNAKRILFPQAFRMPSLKSGQTNLAAGAGQAIEIKTTYTARTDIDPRTFTVKAGQPVRFIVDSKDLGTGCMSTIMIPGLYNQPQLLEKDRILTMNFTA